MASQSALTRYRPVVLAVTGLLAAYGIYYVLLNQPTPLQNTASTLHRSNAVHRRRRRRGQAAGQTASESPGINEEHQDAHPPLVRQDRPPVPGSTPRIVAPRFPINEDDPWSREDMWVTFEPRPTEVETTRLRRCRASYGDAWVIAYIDSYLYYMLPAYYVLTETEQVAADTLLYSRGFSHGEIRAGIARYNAAADPRPNDTELERMEVDQEEELFVQQQPPVDDREIVLDAQTERSFNFGEDQSPLNAMQEDGGQEVKSLLYYIAEENAKVDGYVHRGVTCDHCNVRPIRGVRWRCMNCVDFDLCSTCESLGQHNKTHLFIKINIPAPFLGTPAQAQPVLYPGRPNLCPRDIPQTLKRALANSTGLEYAEIEALWDQFTTLANQEWQDDPNGIGAAIDRIAFDKCLIPQQSNRPPPPNLVYDRIFAFYDSNHDHLIGFEEFVHGVGLLRNKRRNITLKKAFEGYDLDDDGYVSRKDFLRMFRAWYVIAQDMTHDMLLASEDQQAYSNAGDLIRSSRPLSSIFTARGAAMNIRTSGKRRDRYGDLVPEPGHPTILDDRPDQADRAQVIMDTIRPETGANSANDNADVLGAQSFLPLSTTNEGTRRLVGEEAIRERWRRRQFYVDEEEGFVLPAGISADAEEEAIGRGFGPTETPKSPRSRSSSKVRFQDDPDFDSRSNASTSSRPFGERWGGYELPEAERDLGKEVLYQVIQQGMNELLDPLFKRREERDFMCISTRRQRAKWNKEIFLEATATDPDIKAEGSKAAKTAPNPHDPYIYDPEVMEQPLDKLLLSAGYITVNEQVNKVPTASASTLDPTMPQNMPDKENHVKVLEHRVLRDGDDYLTAERLSYLAGLEVDDERMTRRGGPGRISYQEFVDIAQSDNGENFVFVEGWLDLASF